MSQPQKQHLIDPEICIRCYTCEMTCSLGAIEHDDNNVVVNPDLCEFCMDCIPVCPTGSIDEWRVVSSTYTTERQFSFLELPVQEDMASTSAGGESDFEAFDEAVSILLAKAHQGTGGKPVAPASAAKPTINLYSPSKPGEAIVQGNYRLTLNGDVADVRHIILNLGSLAMPVLEGQNIGVIPPGTDENGQPHLPRLYSVSSPRDGERPNFNNLSLTVKREENGICSNYVCDLKKGDKVKVTGPFGATFLLPEDPHARLLMVCTGTGSAPFRAFTMRRQRTSATTQGGMTLFFGARSPDSLPYFGPLKKMPKEMLHTFLVFSRLPGQPKEYVQDRMLVERETVGDLLSDRNTHIYICGLRGMEAGVESALTEIAGDIGADWSALRDTMRIEGRYHVETY